MTQLEINELKVNYKVVKSSLEIAQQLVTNEGFYLYWFEQLGNPKNREKSKSDVFEQVNALYMRIFKVSKGKYNSYDSFRIATQKRKRNN